MKAHHNQAEIDDLIGVHKSTISREFHRNSGLRGYRPQQAHRLCLQRRTEKVMPRIASSIWRLVERLLRQDWIDYFGFPLLLLETFVDPDLYHDMIYRASNWVLVGSTRGYSRIRGGYSAKTLSQKLVFV